MDEERYPKLSAILEKLKQDTHSQGSKLLESTRRFREDFGSNNGITTQSLVDWNRPETQQKLRILSLAFLHAKGADYWPDKGNRSTLEYPRDLQMSVHIPCIFCFSKSR